MRTFVGWKRRVGRFVAEMVLRRTSCTPSRQEGRIERSSAPSEPAITDAHSRRINP